MTQLSLAKCTKELMKQYFKEIDGNYSQAGNLHKLILEQVEKPLLEEVLLKTQGNKVQAAKILGINRNTLSKKLINYGIE